MMPTKAYNFIFHFLYIFIKDQCGQLMLWLCFNEQNEDVVHIQFLWSMQGVVAFHEEIVEYFNRRGVSVIFLFRKNPLRRLVSVLANSYDRQARLLNGTHKSHVHSIDEVPLLLLFCSNSKQTCPSGCSTDPIDAVNVQAKVLATYKPVINCASLINDLEGIENATADALEYFKSTRHIILYYEDLMNNRTVSSQIMLLSFVYTHQFQLMHHLDY